MSWEDEVKRRAGAKPVVCVEIELDSGTLQYSNTNLREDTAYWAGKIQSIDEIRRGVSLAENTSLIINDIRISLNNNDADAPTGAGYFATFAPPYGNWEGKPVNVYLKFKADDGTIQSKQIFSGLCKPVSFSAAKLVIDASPRIREKVRLYQRAIKGVEFSGYSVPDKSVGQALNIILGTVDANKGAVFCPQIDDTGNSEKFCVAQHAVKSVDGVWTKRGETLTALTLTTHYTVTKSATDGDSNKYSYITLTATATSSGKYQDGDEVYVNAKGLESAGDGTGTLYSNPASAFEQVLLQFTELTSSDIDSTSITAAETTCTSRDYDDTGYFGTCIPFVNSGNRLEGSGYPWDVLQAIARGFHHQIYMTTDGKVGLASIDITASDTPTVTYTEKNGDFRDGTGPVASYGVVDTVNERRSRWKVAQSVQNGTQGFTRGYNSTSQSTIGILEADTTNRTAQNDAVLQDILVREMSLSSGNAVMITWTTSGLQGLQSGSDIGDYVGMTHGRVLAGFNEQPLQVIEVSADLMNCETTIKAIGVQDGFILGSVAIESIATQQEQFSIVADSDTYVDSGAQGTPHTSDTVIHHGNYAQYDSGEGEFEEVGRRIACRYATTSASGTVLSAALRIYVTEVSAFISPAGPSVSDPSIKVCRLNDTSWVESDTYSSFPWNDSLITTEYSNAQSAVAGYMQFELNTTAKSYIQTQVTAGNPVELTFSVDGVGIGTQISYMNNSVAGPGQTCERLMKIASSEHTTSALRPTLILVCLV